MRVIDRGKWTVRVSERPFKKRVFESGRPWNLIVNFELESRKLNGPYGINYMIQKFLLTTVSFGVKVNGPEGRNWTVIPRSWVEVDDKQVDSDNEITWDGVKYCVIDPYDILRLI